MVVASGDNAAPLGHCNGWHCEDSRYERPTDPARIVEVSLAVFLGMLAFFRPYTMLWQNMAKAAMCILSMMGSALNFLGYLQIEGIVGENVVINVSIALFSMLAIFAVFMIVAFGVEVVRTALEEETAAEEVPMILSPELAALRRRWRR